MGTWKISKGIEKLLQRMLSPNADLRCTASQAIADDYWHPRKESLASHSELLRVNHLRCLIFFVRSVVELHVVHSF